MQCLVIKCPHLHVARPHPSEAHGWTQRLAGLKTLVLSPERLSHDCTGLIQRGPLVHQVKIDFMAATKLSLKIIQDAGLASHLPLMLGAHPQVSLELLNLPCLALELDLFPIPSLELSFECVDVICVLLQLCTALHADLELSPQLINHA